MSKKKVLVVDDESLVRKVIVRALDRIGYEAVDVADGRTALDVVGNDGDGLVCVLLDLTMPDLDGYETFRRIRALRSELPIVIMTGYDIQDVTQRLAPDVADGFLGKPFMMADVQAAMQRLD